MEFKQWVLEWGVKSLAAIGFKAGEPRDDERRSDQRTAGAQAGLLDARLVEATRGDASVVVVAWRYGNVEQAGEAVAALSHSGLFEGSAHRMLIGPTVFHLFQRGGDEALTRAIMARILDYPAVPVEGKS